MPANLEWEEQALAQQVHLEAGAAHDRVARLLHQAQHPRCIDAHEIAAPLLDFARDEDGIDVARDS